MIQKSAEGAISTGASLPWIRVCPGAPYFEDEHGQAWHPVGHNDAISWLNLSPLFRRRDVAAVEGYFADLAGSGVTVLRLMLEYAQVRHRYFEKPVGVFAPAMVRLWDDIFALAERAGVRLLLTPYDTFWMWLHWRHHPYNTKNGGPLSHPSRLLLCPETRKLIKARLTFAVRRWGGSGALFAWDLWNEIHPAQAENKADVFPEFIADLSRHVRAEEERLYARSHPQTVSLFGPELEWKPHMPLREPVFRHPDLDFTNVHIYQQGSIDDPQNTIDGAVAMARIVREHTSQVPAGRPYFDSEHGPIHAFKDRKKTLPEVFDDEYFRHMQWAHLAAGGAGGGMRWPNRSPHRLTPGMGLAQKAFSEFLPEINWRSFRRGPYDIHLATQRHVAAIASGDESQAVVYLLRTDRLSPAGMIDRGDPAASLDLRFRGCTRAAYSVTAWDTRRGVALARTIQAGSPNGMAYSTPPFNGDVALAIRCVE